MKLRRDGSKIITYQTERSVYQIGELINVFTGLVLNKVKRVSEKAVTSSDKWRRNTIFPMLKIKSFNS